MNIIPLLRSVLEEAKILDESYGRSFASDDSFQETRNLAAAFNQCCVPAKAVVRRLEARQPVGVLGSDYTLIASLSINILTVGGFIVRQTPEMSFIEKDWPEIENLSIVKNFINYHKTSGSFCRWSGQYDQDFIDGKNQDVVSQLVEMIKIKQAENSNRAITSAVHHEHLFHDISPKIPKKM